MGVADRKSAEPSERSLSRDEFIARAARSQVNGAWNTFVGIGAFALMVGVVVIAIWEKGAAPSPTKTVVGWVSWIGGSVLWCYGVLKCWRNMRLPTRPPLHFPSREEVGFAALPIYVLGVGIEALGKPGYEALLAVPAFLFALVAFVSFVIYLRKPVVRERKKRSGEKWWHPMQPEE